MTSASCTWKAGVCLLSCSYSAASFPRLLGTWWEGGGKTNLCYSVWFFSSYLPFSSASDSIFCLWCNSGFPSQPREEPDKSLQFPSCAQGSEQQPATSRVSFCFTGWLLRKKKPSQTVYTFLMFGKAFFQFQESEIYLIKIKPYMNIPLAFPEAKQSKLPWIRGKGISRITTDKPSKITSLSR